MSNFGTAKPHKEEVAKKVDLSAFRAGGSPSRRPARTERKDPGAVKEAQSHFFVSVLQKETPMSQQHVNNVLAPHKDLWVKNSFDGQTGDVKTLFLPSFFA